LLQKVHELTMQTVRDESKKLLMCNVLAFKVNVICAYRFIQVLQEIVELQKYCELLKKCIKEKEAPLKVAHTRLVTRVSRPGVEACKDSTQYRYITLSCVFFCYFTFFCFSVSLLPISTTTSIQDLPGAIMQNLFCFPVTEDFCVEEK